MPLTDYPDLGFGIADRDKKPQLQLVDTMSLDNFGKAPVFSMSPSVVHFGGFKIGEDLEQSLSVVNCSPNSIRMLISPPESAFFTVLIDSRVPGAKLVSNVLTNQISYTKSGTLAPGMSQQLVVSFHPSEYRYYYDCIRIRSPNQSYVVPLHGYPLLNKVNVPRILKFSDAPLCGTVQKVLLHFVHCGHSAITLPAYIFPQKITLRCSIPMPFYFSVQVLRPHPYFRIEPLHGEIPAEGSADIIIFFHPITLGTSATTIKVHIMQHGYEAFETIVSARAISGALEQMSLQHAQDAVFDFALKRGSTVNELLGQSSSFRGDPTLKSTTSGAPAGMHASLANSKSFNKSKIFMTGGPKNHLLDPVALMLSSTFRASDLPGALDNALIESLLGSKRKVAIDMGPLMGLNKVLGESMHTKKVRPRGPGSGAVFDAGAQWVSSRNLKRFKQLQRAKARLAAVPEADIYTTVEGLRIPENLDTVGTVGFVLTQETGKLKPKDLKAAIEKNRAERKKRADEQQKIRDQGGQSALGGVGLDLRSILSEEQLNVQDGNAFKRQLREMAFLADVDDVNKEEIEKTFRTSEQFLGSNQLSQTDLDIIVAQRRLAARHAAVDSWSRTIDRQHTESFAPYHPTEKAGSLKPQLRSTSMRPHCITSLSPELSFDVNRNDIWAKRMNTQKRFISIVTRWIVQRRATERLRKIKDRLRAAGVTDRESCSHFVVKDNGDRVHKIRSSGKEFNSGAMAFVGAVDESVATIVCSMPSQILFNRLAGEAALAKGPQPYSHKMVRRNLFPKYFMDQSGERTPLDTCDIVLHKGFDDRTLFQTKVRPEYITAGYHEIEPSPVPVFFPQCSAKRHRQGAFEEGLLRPAADNQMKSKSLLAFPPESMEALASLVPSPPPAVDDKGKSIALNEETEFAAPAWLSYKGEISLVDIDFSRPRPDLRTYVLYPKRRETDHDWVIRPFGEKMEYDDDNSWGGKLLNCASGFSSAHSFLLGAYEMRTRQEPPAASGPTLTDFYCPDIDRHRSGLNCFTKDHQRTLTSRDPEILPTTDILDDEDILSDSESDDENAYKKAYNVDNGVNQVMEKPSLAAARQILRATLPVEEPPSPTGKGKKGAPAFVEKATENTGNTTAGSTAESFTLNDSDRRNDQVELMRDRKILDMEILFKKRRQQDADAISRTLVRLSEGSRCQLFALRVQLPFHNYEDLVYSEVEKLSPEPQSLFVEPSQRFMNNQSLMLTDSSWRSPGGRDDEIALQPTPSPP